MKIMSSLVSVMTTPLELSKHSLVMMRRFPENKKAIFLFVMFDDIIHLTTCRMVDIP